MNNLRIKLVFGVFISCFFILLARSIQLTLFPDKRLHRQTQMRSLSERGIIYDQKLNPIALNIQSFSLYVRPNSFSHTMKLYLEKKLEALTFLSKEDLTPLFSDTNFTYIKKRLTTSQARIMQDMIDELEENHILSSDQMELERSYPRLYPTPGAETIVGLVGTDGYGLLGIEYTLDEYLSKGYNVYTTLRSDFTKIAFQELKKRIIEVEAARGSVGIIDTKTHQILALVEYPSYNPNDFSSLTKTNTRSFASSYIFEPGSSMKAFSAAYAIDRKLVGVKEKIHIPSKVVKIYGFPFNCYHYNPYMDLENILKYSCNAGMGLLALNFEDKDYYQYLVSLGFGRKLNLPLPNIEKGILRSPSRWSGLSKPMMSIGQEIGITTLQFLSAAATLGNGGEYITPSLIRAVIDENGENVYQSEKEHYRVLSIKSSRQTIKLLESVLTVGGTGYRGKIEGITLAGKTGTGQVADLVNGGYTEHGYSPTFLGFAPSENTSLAIVIVINEPNADIAYGGGSVSAPVFANIVRRIITSTDYKL